jgi:hypothetical protein
MIEIKLKEVHMEISQTTLEKDASTVSVHGSTCPFESESGHFCHAAVMTVVMSSYQKRTYCWTDDYSSCPMFLAKILRGRKQRYFMETGRDTCLNNV